jgi:hypothetical protein
MKRLHVCLFLLTLLVISTLVSGFHFSSGQTPIEVKGIIDSNTTWTKADSPYTLVGPLAINKGITLTIEPGVTVNLKDYYIQVNGTLIAKGTSADNIQFNGGTIDFTEVNSNWNQQTSSGCIIENANLSLTFLFIKDCSPKIYHNSITSGISINGGAAIISNNIIQTLSMGSVIQVAKGSPVITYNQILTKRFDDMGNPDTYGGISMENAINAYIYGNTFKNLAGASIYAGKSSGTILRNHLSNGIEGGGELIIENNTIGEGITNPSSASTILYNNILSGDIQLTGSGNINATYNWWGTTDTSEIDRRIIDFNDDFNLGKVTYTPFLTEANPEAIPDSNALLPTPNTTSTPTISPTATSSSSPSQNPTATPLQPNGVSVFLGLDWVGVAIVALLAVIAVLLVVVVVFLRRRSVVRF